MALNLAPAAAPTSPPFQIARGKDPPNRPITTTTTTVAAKKQLSPCRAARSEGVTEESGVTEGSSARAQLDLLEQLTSTGSVSDGHESDGSSGRLTIRDQLSQLVGDRVGDFSLPLGKRLKASLNSLTISQKRNIRRQAYLNVVSERNDTVFYITIAAFVVLPPFLILIVAVLTGYVDLRP